MQFDAKNKRDNAPLEKVTLSHFNKGCSAYSIIGIVIDIYKAVSFGIAFK